MLSDNAMYEAFGEGAFRLILSGLSASPVAYTYRIGAMLSFREALTIGSSVSANFISR